MKKIRIALLSALVLGGCATPPPRPVSGYPVLIVNKSSHRVWFVYTKASSDESGYYYQREHNLLLKKEYTGSIPPNETMLIDFRVRHTYKECLQDVMAASIPNPQRATWTRRLNVCEESVWTLLD